MKKQGALFFVLRALARQFQNQANFLFKLVSDEALAVSQPETDAKRTFAAQQDAAQGQSLGSRETEVPPAHWLMRRDAGELPAHWLRRVQQAAPALFSGKEPIRRSGESPLLTLPIGQGDANAHFRQLSRVDVPGPEVETSAPVSEQPTGRSLPSPRMGSDDAGRQRDLIRPQQGTEALSYDADRMVANYSRVDSSILLQTPIALDYGWDPNAQRAFDGSENGDGGKFRSLHAKMPETSPGQSLYDGATNQPARLVPATLPAAPSRGEAEIGSVPELGAAAISWPGDPTSSKLGTAAVLGLGDPASPVPQPGTGAKKTLTIRPDTAWKRDVHGAESDVSSIAQPAEDDADGSSARWQRHAPHSMPALFSRKEQASHSTELLSFTLPENGSMQMIGARRSTAEEREQRKNPGQDSQFDASALLSQKRWPDLQVDPDFSPWEVEPGMCSTQSASRASWPKMNTSATTSHRQSQSWMDEDIQPEMRWPSLPDETMTHSQDWEMTQQAWRRQQRLDEEQRGSLWNA